MLITIITHQAAIKRPFSEEQESSGPTAESNLPAKHHSV